MHQVTYERALQLAAGILAGPMVKSLQAEDVKHAIITAYKAVLLAEKELQERPPTV